MVVIVFVIFFASARELVSACASITFDACSMKTVVGFNIFYFVLQEIKCEWFVL